MVTDRSDFLWGSFFLEAHDDFVWVDRWRSFDLSGALRRMFTLEHPFSPPQHKPSEGFVHRPPGAGVGMFPGDALSRLSPADPFEQYRDLAQGPYAQGFVAETRPAGANVDEGRATGGPWGTLGEQVAVSGGCV